MEVSKKCVPLHPRSRKTHKTEQIGAVVQLVRIPACHAGGRGFESRPHREGVTKTSFSYPLSFFFEKRDFLTPVDFRLRPLLGVFRAYPARSLRDWTSFSYPLSFFFEKWTYSGMAGMSSMSTRAFTGWRSLLRAPRSISLRDVLMML